MDAAGGTLEGPGRGVGAVIPAYGIWCYMPWTPAVNSGSWVVGGKKVSRKMAALELIGPLMALTAVTSYKTMDAILGGQPRFMRDLETGLQQQLQTIQHGSEGHGHGHRGHRYAYGH